MDVLEKLLSRLDIDIYNEHIFPVVRRLAITFSRLHPRPACLPVYPQPLSLHLLKKGIWEVRIFGSSPLNWLDDKLDWLRDKLDLLSNKI